jgi:hypothetical protein
MIKMIYLFQILQINYLEIIKKIYNKNI